MACLLARLLASWLTDWLAYKHLDDEVEEDEDEEVRICGWRVDCEQSWKKFQLNSTQLGLFDCATCEGKEWNGRMEAIWLEFWISFERLSW